MSVYSYPQSDVIKEITFRKNAQGGMRAYLHARPDADPATIKEILDHLNGRKMDCIPGSLDGKPVLEVRGFKNEKKFRAAVKQWIPGEPRIMLEPSDQITMMDKFRKRTLQASGVSYLVGDYGFVKYGLREADKLVVAGAISYFLGTLSLVFYGRNDKSDLQVKDFAQSLKHHLESENIQPTPGSALHEATKPEVKDPAQKFHEFMKRYPSEAFNSVTALAGVFVAASAYKHKVKFVSNGHLDAQALREIKHEGWMDFGLGSITAASGVLATLVKEKKPDPDDPPARGLNWLKQQIQAHPLAIAGGGYTIATMCHAASTYKAYKEAKRLGDKKRLASVPNRALFVGAAFLSEFLLAISSKGHGQGVTSDESVQRSVISLAASLVTMYPDDKKETLIKDLSAFLSKPEVLALKTSDIEKDLRQEVNNLEKNPWVITKGLNDSKQIAPQAQKPQQEQ
ncbi:MAG: hypothetical protein AB7L92_08465, partial [Alphaproteobacteria bacterium]